MKKMGRPKKEIKKDLFEKLCELQCTESEICGIFDVCEDTLNSWCKETYDMTFSDTFKKKSARGRMSLRRTQFRIADSGNATMAIWLGKQWLGQKDNIEVESSQLIRVEELLSKIEEEANK